MKALPTLAALLWQVAAYGQPNASIRFQNDYADVYHLSLILYLPDGRNQTRVSNLEPGATKTYALPVGTEIYIADNKQEAYAMKGNDIKATGLKPTFVLASDNTPKTVLLRSLSTVAGRPKSKE
jgi:hypothetical protein